MTTLRRLDHGEISLEDPLTISQPNASVECADWGCTTYGPGKKVTIRKLLWDMITLSNNIATKAMINETADLLGVPTLRVNRKVYNIQDAEPKGHESNRASAGGYVEMYREIAIGHRAVLSQSSRTLLVKILRIQQLLP